jgi:predicted ATPase
MRLTSIRAENFKSFRNLDIQLDNLNVLIGANASGKSNFVQLFTFLRDVVESGLENAISIQGGPQYLRNINSDPGANVSIELSVEPDPGDPPSPLISDQDSRVVQCSYRFSLAFNGARSVVVAEDELRVERLGNALMANSNTFVIKQVGEQYQMQGDTDPLGTLLKDSLEARKGQARRPMLLIEYEILRLLLPLNGLKLIATYDIDSKGPKTAVLFGGKSELESDAHNLAIVLDRILTDRENRRKFLNLLRDVLPFADELDTEPLKDSSLFFSMRERFSHLPLPALFLSDGTIDVISVIVILYFERRPFVIIEEPERNLHPSLISKLVELFKDASRHKQIIISTHSPEIVRYVDPSQLILVSRDSSGSSHAERPANKAQIQQFLRDEISMEELYVQNLLEV